MRLLVIHTATTNVHVQHISFPFFTAVAMRLDWQLLLNHKSPSSSLTCIVCKVLQTQASSTHPGSSTRLHEEVIAVSTSTAPDVFRYGRHNLVTPFSASTLTSVVIHGGRRCPNLMAGNHSSTSIVSFDSWYVSGTRHLPAAALCPKPRK